LGGGPFAASTFRRCGVAGSAWGEQGEAKVDDDRGSGAEPSAPDDDGRRARQHAWRICTRAQRAHKLELDLLLLALKHAVAIGAAAIAARDPADRRLVPVQAARLFAGLQVKLLATTPGPASVRLLGELMPQLPERWGETLRVRLRQARGERGGARPANPASVARRASP
jgi:hypothetical protein